MENPQTSYLEEKIIVIRPTTKNQIFNEQDFEVSTVYNKAGQKIILLRSKENAKGDL